MRRALVLIAALVTLGAASASAATPRTSLGDIEDEVMCVVCNTTLTVSEAPQAQRERAFIRALIAQGKTKAEIKEALVAEYGPRVLALPKAEGFDVTAYLVPGALILIGIGLLAVIVPRWRRRAPRTGAPAAAGGPSPAELSRLDDDLSRYD